MKPKLFTFIDTRALEEEDEDEEEEEEGEEESDGKNGAVCCDE